MSEPLQLKTELRTRIRGMEFTDYVVSLVYKHLSRLYTIRAERRSAQKEALVADGTKARTAEEEGEASSDGSFTKHINHSGAELRRRQLEKSILAGSPRSRQKARLGRTAILPCR